MLQGSQAVLAGELRVGSKEKLISPSSAHRCCPLTCQCLALSCLQCTVPKGLWTLYCSECFADTTNAVVYYFYGDGGAGCVYITTVSKSEAKLCSQSKKGSQETFISSSSPAAIKFCLATPHYLVCQTPGVALQLKDTGFRSICWKPFTKLFSNFNAGFSQLNHFWGRAAFKELGLNLCWGDPFSTCHNI